MPWFRLDIHWYLDEKIEAAAEIAGGVVFALFPVLLAKAKAQADGGKVEFTFRSITRETFFEREQIEQAIEAFVSAGVLTCPQVSARGATVAFDSGSWRRWQEAARKAASREELKAA